MIMIIINFLSSNQIYKLPIIFYIKINIINHNPLNEHILMISNNERNFATYLMNNLVIRTSNHIVVHLD